MTSNNLLRVEGAERLRDLSRDLRRRSDGTQLRTLMRRELRDIVEEIVRAEQAAVRALPSKGQNAARGLPSTREQIARATTSQIRTAGKDVGVRAWVNPKRLPEGKKNLPAYMNREPGFTRWRHPVFAQEGRTRTYVDQPPKPWWYRTARPLEEQAVTRTLAVLSRFVADLERD
jgi:hypothetical protein